MVVRKSSMPYPASPPPPPPEPSTQQSHRQLDAADIPPVPQASSRSNVASNFEEMGNPWSEDYSSRVDRGSDVPNQLKLGINRAPAASQNSLQAVPDVLRPGWSGEATPRSSLDSDRDRFLEREWWDDDDEVEADKHNHEPQGLHVVNNTPASQPSLTIKKKPLPQSQPPPQQHSTDAPPFNSNNPFGRPSENFFQPPNDLSDWGSESKSKELHGQSNPLRSHPSTDRLGQLNLNDPAPMDEKEAVPQAPITAPPPPPPLPAQPPPPIPQLQEPLRPTITGDQNANPWATPNKGLSKPSPVPSPIPFPSSKQHNTVSTDDLLDRGQHQGSASLGAELQALPNNPTAPRPSGVSEVSLLEDHEPRPSLPSRPARRESEDMYSAPTSPVARPPPIKPPRPAVVTSEHDLARMREQRNETYQIKHFNWYDLRTSRMRRSSMLTQNKNGPCPLLALVNALILGATEDMQAALDDALRPREQVTLGLIVETLMDELVSRASLQDELVLPEIDELNRFLMRLRTGMNANPRFVPPAAPALNLMDAESPATPTVSRPQENAAGTFEKTQDIKLYGSFGVQLVHGWLPTPGDQAAHAFARSAQTYEDAQAVQFGEEELEYKLSSGGLSQQEQQVWEDITSIKQFLQAYPTQLTSYGLASLHSTLKPGEFAILFRNDHFSTIYKHPRDQRLYTLITDAGYADRDEIIWESLEDISGSRSEFFSGDFSSVSHGDSRHAMPHSQTAAANPGRTSSQLQPTNYFPTVPMTPQEQQEQHDADFAMALQLQEEEEQRMRQPRSQTDRAGRCGGQRGQRRSGQGIPIPLRGNQSGEVRPTIPPRNTQSRNQGVNRPVDADAVDAPPAYEEAARTQAYMPPLGSPLHPSSSTGLTGRASTSTTTVHGQGQTTGVTQRGPRPGDHMRRTSAYGENHDRYDHSPDYSAGAFGPSYAFMTPTGTEGRRARTDRDRDCVLM